jgi:transcriptional regulator of nitric oxide reductase
MLPTLAAQAADLAASLRTRAVDPVTVDLAERLAEHLADAARVPAPAPARERQANRQLAGRVLALLVAVWVGWLLAATWP